MTNDLLWTINTIGIIAGIMGVISVISAMLLGEYITKKYWFLFVLHLALLGFNVYLHFYLF